jgi:carbonic anhydrase
VIDALDALIRLRDGNRRFAADDRTGHARLGARPADLIGGQEPFAIIMGCSDSRVPAEIVFDQGLGDLFVIRVAGNVVAPSQIGSVEFAATKFGTRLVVVLGHSECGAIHATVEELRAPSELRSRNLRSIVDFVRPSVQSLIDEGLGSDLNTLVAEAVRANVRASAEHLRHGSDILEELERDEGLVIVGAEYSLETGLVDFFDGVPEGASIEG